MAWIWASIMTTPFAKPQSVPPKLNAHRIVTASAGIMGTNATPACISWQTVRSYFRVALKHGLDTVGYRSRDATVRSDEL
jgi:hypothetical protein